MTFTFSAKLPHSINVKPILISGADSSELNAKEYLTLNQNGVAISLFEIRYDYHCSPFKEVMMIDHILAVGFEEFFYMFDMTRESNILKLRMDGYFGHLYFDNEFFYVADARGLHCIDKHASVIWQNNNLGIDGVIVNRFADNKIFGRGECDPPGGWNDFILDDQTGRIKK